jgi:hypothetical protein
MKNFSYNRNYFINKFVFLFIFSLAMGYLEGTVAVYLRQIYYNNGPIFPLNTLMTDYYYLVEVAREFATLVMIFAIAYLSGKIFIERFSYFLFVFGAWDIIYYLSLKAIINWPSDIFEWDLLFLIPLPWLGPVFAPSFTAFLMILISIGISYNLVKYDNFKNLKKPQWLLIFFGYLFIFVSFISNFITLIFRNINLIENINDVKSLLANYIPSSFNWWIYCLGIGLLFIVIFNLFFTKSKNQKNINLNSVSK